MVRDGLTEAEARSRVYVLDSKGLLTTDRRMEDGGLAATWLFGQETLCAFGTNNQMLPMQMKSTRTMTRF